MQVFLLYHGGPHPGGVTHSLTHHGKKTIMLRAFFFCSQITKKTYVRALYKAVTLDPSLVWAYHTDVDQHELLRQDGGGRGGRALPQATLRVFAGTDGLAPVPPPREPPPPVQQSISVGESSQHRGGGGGGEGASAMLGEGATSDDLRAREAELRDGFLRQVRLSEVA